jgi:DNA-binding Lrp family transcriptional regulator
MDNIEKILLQYLSKSFPIDKCPFSTAGHELEIDEEKLLITCRKLKEDGVIRRIGATIDPKKIGWYSTLCATNVPEDKISLYIQTVNSFSEVTHNYEREGKPNCWFTIIAPERKRCLEIVSKIQSACGIAVIELPARRIFKIGVKFSL